MAKELKEKEIKEIKGCKTLWSDASGVKKMEVRSVDGVFKGRQ